MDYIYADEKFVGFVDSLQGDVFIIKGEETVKLNEFDQIFANQKILVVMRWTMKKIYSF